MWSEYPNNDRTIAELRWLQESFRVRACITQNSHGQYKLYHADTMLLISCCLDTTLEVLGPGSESAATSVGALSIASHRVEGFGPCGKH
jgi:hypothetical protein